MLRNHKVKTSSHTSCRRPPAGRHRYHQLDHCCTRSSHLSNNGCQVDERDTHVRKAIVIPHTLRPRGGDENMDTCLVSLLFSPFHPGFTLSSETLIKPLIISCIRKLVCVCVCLSILPNVATFFLDNLKTDYMPQ